MHMHVLPLIFDCGLRENCVQTGRQSTINNQPVARSRWHRHFELTSHQLQSSISISTSISTSTSISISTSKAIRIARRGAKMRESVVVAIVASLALASKPVGQVERWTRGDPRGDRVEGANG